jgi:DNA-directed RNA polymerase specialized sigma24 family protein
MAQRDLRRVKKVADQIEQAREALARAVLAAQESGETLRDIAPYAGLSTSRVHEMIREARKQG